MASGSIVERVREAAYKHALINAVRHGGKARLGPVVNKVVAECPEIRPSVRDFIPVIEAVVREVNQLPLSEQARVVSERWPEALERRAEGPRGLPPLPNVGKYGRVVTRFAPNPDFVLTIGNARAAILSYKYAEMYRGAFILRFEDTDPRIKRPIPEAYDLIREDLRWLGLKWDYEYVQSLRMPVYYYYARRLIELGGAYVCTHSGEEVRALRAKGARCGCASLSVEEQLERWDRMVRGEYAEGEAVLRVKTDPRHPDPSVRDWVAFRVIDTSKYPHPIVGDKYVAWPTYNFAAAVDDHLMGVTHILRGKEHISNTVKQRYLYAHFGWEYPETIHYGRLKLEGVMLSKSKMRRGIEEGRYEGWDDPRLGTLVALRRRGILPETVRDLMLELGVKESEATISLKNLHAINRRYVEPRANRYMFVDSPAPLVVKCEGRLVARVPRHPSFPERGYREIALEPEGGAVTVLVPRADLEELPEGGLIRLLGLANVRVVRKSELGAEAVVHSLDPADARALGLKVIQWVPENGIPTAVLKAEGAELRVVRGVSEPAAAELRVGDIAQFYRFGFVRVEERLPGELRAVYTHE